MLLFILLHRIKITGGSMQEFSDHFENFYRALTLLQKYRHGLYHPNCAE